MTNANRAVRRSRIGAREDDDPFDLDDHVGPARPTRRGARLIQFGLPVLAAALVAGFFWFRDTGDGPLDMSDALELAASGKLTDPHFLGQTDKGEPVSLRASAARPDSLDLNRVELDDLIGEVRTEDGRLVTLKAASGLYDRQADTIEAAGGVVIATDDGFEFTTEKLSAAIRNGVAVSDGKVRGSGPQGRITAGRMEISFSNALAENPSRDAAQDAAKDVVARFSGGVQVMIDNVAESRATGE